MSTLKLWILAARPKTLFAALAPIIIGLSLSYKIAGIISWNISWMIVLSATLLQIGSNYANDAYDYLKGADRNDRKGPKRAVQLGKISPKKILNAMYVIFIVSVIIGFFLARIGGWPIVAIGLLSIFFAIIYTGGPYPLAYNGLGDITVFVFFGLIATMGTVYLQLTSYNIEIHNFIFEIIIGACSAGLLNTAILVVNNLRDVDSDRLANKRTLAVKFGAQFTCYEFSGLLLGNCLCLCLLAYTWNNYILVIVAMIVGGFSYILIRKVFQFKKSDLNKVLEKTAQLSFLNSILFFLAIII